MRHWTRLTVVNDEVRTIMSDDTKRTTEMIVFDFERPVATGDLLTAIAMNSGKADFRFFSVKNVAEMRSELFGDGEKTGALPQCEHADTDEAMNEPACMVDCIELRDWLAWPLVKILDKLIDWCGVKA